MLKYLLAFSLCACASVPTLPTILNKVDDVREVLCHEPTEAYVVECLMAAQALDTYENLPSLANAKAVVERLDMLASAACASDQSKACQELTQDLAALNALMP